MQISITNGTLTQISETLSPASGYTLPTTIEVTGATSSYDSSTGEVILTDITSAMTLVASGVQEQQGISNIKFGNVTISKVYFGSKEVTKVMLGNNVVFEKSGEPSGNLLVDTNGDYIVDVNDNYLEVSE